MPRRKSSSSAVATLPTVRPLGKYERLAYERAKRDHKEGHKRGLWFDQAAADHVIAFFEDYLRHFEGEWAGQPIKLEPEQKFMLSEVFGWKRADGTRRFRTAHNEVSRKFGKSLMGGGVGLYLEGPDQEPGAQVYAAATKEEQARIVHDAAKNMVDASDELKEFFQVFAKAITCPIMGATFKPLGANSKTQDGMNAHGAIIDEVHAHTDRRVYMKLKTSMGARRQPLTYIITTAGIYDPESIGWELHEYACKVLDGVFDDDSLFAYICAADEGDDWTDPATWWKANPNLGISVKWDYVREQCEEAKRRPSYENEFRQMYCNEWVEQVERWLQMSAWKACGGPLRDLENRVCYGGLDLSSKLDLTSLCLDFPDSDKTHDFLWRCWIPEARIAEMERSLTGRVPMAQWRDAGWLIPTPGNAVDYHFIREEINKLGQQHSIKEIGFDPFTAWQLAQELSDEDGFTMVETRQGMRSMSEPSKELERLVVTKALRHGDNPVARWCASNAVIRRDCNANYMPDKAKATGKIDAIVAAIIAISRSILYQDTTSIYETRGMREV